MVGGVRLCEAKSQTSMQSFVLPFHRMLCMHLLKYETSQASLESIFKIEFMTETVYKYWFLHLSRKNYRGKPNGGESKI